MSTNYVERAKMLSNTLTPSNLAFPMGNIQEKSF